MGRAARPPCTDPIDLARHTRLDDDQLEQKLAALVAHRAQTGPLIEMLSWRTYREWWPTQSFRCVTSVAQRRIRRQ